MTYTPIPQGTPDWDVPVNAAFTDQDGRITTNEASISSLTTQANNNTTSINTINSNLATLEWQPQDHGLKAWSFDPSHMQGTNVAVATGTVYLVKVLLRQSATFTSLIYNIQNAGSSLTVGQNFVGLYDASGNQLRISADQTTNFGGIGTKTAGFTGGPIALTPGAYYAALLANGTGIPSTLPAPAHGAIGFASALNVGLTAATGRYITGPTAQTSLPPTIDLVATAVTDNASAKWFAFA